jgi:hypothetical protein
MKGKEITSFPFPSSFPPPTLISHFNETYLFPQMEAIHQYLFGTQNFFPPPFSSFNHPMHSFPDPSNFSFPFYSNPFHSNVSFQVPLYPNPLLPLQPSTSPNTINRKRKNPNEEQSQIAACSQEQNQMDVGNGILMDDEWAKRFVETSERRKRRKRDQIKADLEQQEIG